MGKLIPYLIKIISFIALVYLLIYFILSVFLSLEFLVTINKISTVNFILVLAVLSKLLLNTTSFLYCKKVQDSGWIKTFIITAALDLIMIVISFAFNLPSLLTKADFRNNINEKIASIKCIYNSDYNSLNPFQSIFLKSLLLYIAITICMSIYFRFKYKKEIKQ